MATAKHRSSSLRRTVWLIVLVVAAGVAAWAVWGAGLRQTAGAGAAYGAHVACSCRFIEGRSLDDCAKDKLDGMELVRFSENAQARSVTASVPLVASDTATYREGYGCVLDEWRG